LKRIGLYGGTFDPIHNGHMLVIQELILKNIVDYLLILPAGQPRLREQQPIASGAQRRQMCQLAINELPAEIKSKVEVNPIEILRDGLSYTIDTVEAVTQSYEGDTIVVIVGTDAYEKIDQWHRAQELKKMVEFIVIDRPDFPGEHNTEIGAIALSATDIRSHKSDAVPAAVAAFIKEQNLYAS
jgi:nicotinate-nucleotide adenylyltransferase|tara:strand:- start:7679 stop:8230 length:552 start_codon:yes stop_codon:yes gene_type:complete